MASLTELSFNWKGFISAMTANVAFTYRNIYSKKAMVCRLPYLSMHIISHCLCLPVTVLSIARLTTYSSSVIRSRLARRDNTIQRTSSVLPYLTSHGIALLSLQTGMDSTNVYAYISIMSLILCIPPALIVSSYLLSFVFHSHSVCNL